MATQLTNFANLTYKYGDSTESILSNTITTNLLDTYGLTVQKFAHNTEWRPSENITYTIRVENTGIEPIYAFSFQDDLGGSDPSLLTYIDNSILMNRAGVITSIIPTSTAPLTVELSTPLIAGEVVTFTHVAKVRGDVGIDITEITNTVTAIGHETSETGTVIIATPATVTIPKANYADLTIEKLVDKNVVVNGEDLTYTFRIENSGNIEATDVTIIDDLPTGFTIGSITSTTNGVTTSFEAGDYSLDLNNRLILPTSIVKTISVPAATLAGNGVTIVTIEGTINV